MAAAADAGASQQHSRTGSPKVYPVMHSSLPAAWRLYASHVSRELPAHDDSCTHTCTDQWLTVQLQIWAVFGRCLSQLFGYSRAAVMPHWYSSHVVCQGLSVVIVFIMMCASCATYHGVPWPMLCSVCAAGDTHQRACLVCTSLALHLWDQVKLAAVTRSIVTACITASMHLVVLPDIQADQCELGPVWLHHQTTTVV